MRQWWASLKEVADFLKTDPMGRNASLAGLTFKEELREIVEDLKAAKVTNWNRISSEILLEVLGKNLFRLFNNHIGRR